MSHKPVWKYLLPPMLCAGATHAGALPGEEESTPEIAVTATREAEVLAEIPATIDIIDGKTIDEVKPAHPGELLVRIPGVHVNVTNGEGHMTAIRQPITTKPMYLYLEDGIPTRSTGFFNHNALYEVNVPQADRVEVLKGPGTALYGSDAIGAVINVMTRPAPEAPEAEVNLEGGGHGWARLLATGGTGWEEGGVRLDLNLTHTDGWRDATEYDRQSATLRWDAFLEGGATVKTVLAASNIDQQTAGSSRLLQDDYYNNPTRNYTPISYRDVQAVRLSVAWEKEDADSLVSVTPYLRHNVMELLPNWSLSYDPTVYETRNDSFGVLFKYRRDFAPMQTRLIAGLDVDYSPGGRTEYSINPTLDTDGRTYVSYTVDSLIYDYDVTYQAFSPYVHVEFSPSERLRLSAGLRYDNAEFDYDNKLGELTTGSHRRPASTTVDFEHLSPKLGATWRIAGRLNAFVSYRHAFRVPSESQLFRQGKAEDTVGLDPVKVDSYEIGVRGGRSGGLEYEVSFYRMVKKDDILTYRDPATGDRYSVNAGETLHRGIETRIVWATGTWDFDLAASYAKHTYEEWVIGSTDYSGNEMESAPRLVASARAGYRAPWLDGGRAELELVRLGSYWMDQANTYKYDGHSLLNLRVNYPFNERLEFHGRVMNLTDRRYATSARYKPASWGKPEKFEYAPGLERTLYIGLRYRFL